MQELLSDIVWDQTNLVLNSLDKLKPGFLLSLMWMFLELTGTKLWSHSFYQTSGILERKMDQKEDPMKKKVDNFKIHKWI